MKVYTYSRQGNSHVALNVECQDCYRCTVSEDGNVTITAVADGVGSCRYAKEGAQIAVNTAVEVCKTYFPIEKNPMDFIAVIHTAMLAAEKEIRRNENPAEFATTLMVVIGVDKTFYYGFCGDGGIIALQNGTVKKITSPQKGSDGESVITLLSGCETIEFGTIEDVDSLLIATDGVYDKLCYNRLCSNDESGLYNNLCYALMDVDVCDSGDPEKIYEEAFNGNTDQLYENLFRCMHRDGNDDKAILEQIRKNAFFARLLNGIYDDITLVVISCGAGSQTIPAEMHAENDLAALLADLNRQLYPGLNVQGESDSEETAVPEPDEASRTDKTSFADEKNGKKAKKKKRRAGIFSKQHKRKKQKECDLDESGTPPVDEGI